MATIEDMLGRIENGIEEIYCNGKIKEDLTIEGLSNFKNKVSCINNTMALIQTVVFLDKLVEEGRISEEKRKKILDRIDKPNANGYDVYDEDLKIVAELKGTVPCQDDNNKFGANQKKSIKQDLENLKVSASKNKGKKKETVTSDFDRYIVVFDVAATAMDTFKDLMRENEVEAVFIDTKSVITEKIKKQEFNFDI